MSKEKLTAEEMARYKAMLELTSGSVEDGERVYTEKELKDRAKEAWDEAINLRYYCDEETDLEFEKWYNESYEK